MNINRNRQSNFRSSVMSIDQIDEYRSPLFKEAAVRKGMQVRASALNEELGKVQFVFTDKTGTLTQNKMELSKLSVGGVKMLHDLGSAGDVNVEEGFVNLSDAINDLCSSIRQDGIQDSPLYHLVVNLLVCSETLISKKDGCAVRYLSPSPDEVAFAEALDAVGVHFVQRDANNNVTIDFQGTVFVYETLAVLEFQSSRLRMTVVSKDANGRIIAYCKGGDVRMLPDSETGCGIIGIQQVTLIQSTVKHLEEFACAGSRVLVAAYKPIKRDEFEVFLENYNSAANAIGQRQQRIEDAFLVIETNMRLLGCTAVEDQIQDGVMDTVKALKIARIKVVMLTGDKKETAVTIGQLSGIIEGEKLVAIDKPNGKIPPLKTQYAEILEQLEATSSGKAVLVINGKMLEESILRHPEEFKAAFDAVDSIIC